MSYLLIEIILQTLGKMDDVHLFFFFFFTYVLLIKTARLKSLSGHMQAPWP